MHAASYPVDRSYTRLFYWGIASLAYATLSLQIVLTRFFSVVFYYHFAFAGVSFAMLGLTVATTVVLRQKRYHNIEKIPFLFARHALWFALTSAGLVVLFLTIPLVAPEESIMILGLWVGLLSAVSFYHSGVGITMLLTRWPQSNGRLYAADLTGAALGCAGCVLALFVMDPVALVFLTSAIVAFMATFLAVDRQRWYLRATAVILLGAALLQTILLQANAPHLSVRWAKGKQEQAAAYERWNAFSRVDVHCINEPPRGWGFAQQPASPIDQCILRIDADAETTITAFKGNLEDVSYLKQDVVNSAYLLQPVDHTAVIGIGGGRDILSALVFGVKKVTGIEINPAIFEALTDKFADFSGNLHQRPEIKLINAEARSYLNQQSEKFDLIQISLIDTWAATAAGGLTMTENRLYTTQAWEDFYRTLKKGGMLSVSRWFNPDAHTGEFYRLVAIAAAALEKTGVAKHALREHVVALNVKDIVTVITRTTPITPEEWDRAKTRYQQAGFHILLGPDVSYNKITDTILRGGDSEEFYKNQPENIRPSTDDKPFFFHSKHFSDVFKESAFNAQNNVAVLIVAWMLVLTIIFFVWYMLFGFYSVRHHYSFGVLAVPSLLFTSIGIGFMLIEIAQMQQLMVFLGHPVFGLAVVLFTLLLFSGLGSLTVRDTLSKKSLAWRSGCLLSLLILIASITPEVITLAKTFNTGLRIVVSVGLLAPAAFFMGMMFPLGMGLCRNHYTQALPYFWGLNGAASVLASVAGVVLSMEIGITATFWIGVVFYVISVLGLWWLRALSKGRFS